MARDAVPDLIGEAPYFHKYLWISIYRVRQPPARWAYAPEGA